MGHVQNNNHTLDRLVKEVRLQDPSLAKELLTYKLSASRGANLSFSFMGCNELLFDLAGKLRALFAIACDVHKVFGDITDEGSQSQLRTS